MSQDRDEAEGALRAAVRLLAARPLTRRELIDRLVKRRFEEPIARAAADELERRGLLSDRRAAESAARTQVERGAARGLAEEKLLARGVDRATARRAVSDAAGNRDEAAAALALARKRVRLCPPGLKPESIRRRVFAYLARRGYDEQTATETVERAVAEILPR